MKTDLIYFPMYNYSSYVGSGYFKFNVNVVPLHVE